MSKMAFPGARLTPDDVVDFSTGVSLPNYSGLVYALFSGHPYILWLYPPDEDGKQHWDVINNGEVVVQAELNKFIKENTRDEH